MSSPQGRASCRKIIEEQQGHEFSEKDFDELVEFGLNQEYDVDFDQTWHVQQMLRMGIQLAMLLSQRKWSVWVANDDAPYLICSDNPVATTWATSVSDPLSPAFGTPNTVVSTPINRHVAMVSMLEANLGFRQLDRNGVAAVNSMTGRYANQIYSAGKKFVWLTKKHRVVNAADLLASLSQ